MMEASFHLDTAPMSFDGFVLPPVPFSSDGAPILPSEGDAVVIHNTVFIVSNIVWMVDNDVEKTRVTVHLVHSARSGR